MTESLDLIDIAAQLADLATSPPWHSPQLYVERRLRGIRARHGVAQPLVPGPVFVLHLVPRREVELEIAPLEQLPLMFNGTTHETRIVHDGWLGTGSLTQLGMRAYTHVRRDGVVEAVDTRLLAPRLDAAGRPRGVPARGFDHALTAALTTLACLVREQHPDVDFDARFSILDAGSQRFEISDGWGNSEPFLDDRILLGCVRVEHDIRGASEQLARRIWQAAGHATSPYSQPVPAG